MKITLAEKFVAWLTLLSGLSISAVAVYYSVAGLISIFAAAVIPIAVMGVTLELSKLVATVWLKQNWFIAPRFIKSYLLVAVLILMMITSMGIFGYLSKAHSDQSLVSGDVQAKISVYDEKIKTAKDNIDANRKALKQMDEAVDQVMGRSTSETGADKAVAIRRGQQKERQRLQSEIAAEQKVIAQLNEEAAPIRAEVRKVEAEVGPIKYIAAFLYGDDPDTNVLERAVRAVIIIIVVVFDPLAVILLLASQYSFQYFRRVREEEQAEATPVYVANVGEPPTEEEKAEILAEPVEESILDKHPYLNSEKSFWHKPEGWISVPPQVYTPTYEADDGPLTDEQIEQLKKSVEAFGLANGTILERSSLFPDTTLEDRIATGESYIDGDGNEVVVDATPSEVPSKEEEEEDDALEQWNKMIAEAERAIAESEKTKAEKEEEAVDQIPEGHTLPENPSKGDKFNAILEDGSKLLIFNGDVWVSVEDSDPEAIRKLEESKKKTYMIKDPNGTIQIKTKE